MQWIDPETAFAIVRAFYWAALALFLGVTIAGFAIWIDTVKRERPARKRHFGGV